MKEEEGERWEMEKGRTRRRKRTEKEKKRGHGKGSVKEGERGRGDEMSEGTWKRVKKKDINEHEKKGREGECKGVKH